MGSRKILFPVLFNRAFTKNSSHVEFYHHGGTNTWGNFAIAIAHAGYNILARFYFITRKMKVCEKETTD
jgi:hypothetical protein